MEGTRHTPWQTLTEAAHSGVQATSLGLQCPRTVLWASPMGMRAGYQEVPLQDPEAEQAMFWSGDPSSRSLPV